MIRRYITLIYCSATLSGLFALPTAVVAHNRQEVPLWNLKGDVSQGGLRDPRIGISQAVDLNRMHLSSPQPFFQRSF